MAEDYHLKFPVAAQVIKDCFYVDDVLTGAQSIEEASSAAETRVEPVAGTGLHDSKKEEIKPP